MEKLYNISIIFANIKSHKITTYDEYHSMLNKLKVFVNDINEYIYKTYYMNNDLCSVFDDHINNVINKGYSTIKFNLPHIVLRNNNSKYFNIFDNQDNEYYPPSYLFNEYHELLHNIRKFVDMISLKENMYFHDARTISKLYKIQASVGKYYSINMFNSDLMSDLNDIQYKAICILKSYFISVGITHYIDENQCSVYFYYEPTENDSITMNVRVIH